ncbi:hypothetical protein H6G25_02945 [Dolichospermum sp. FACHB-1091]|nr:hypothetical protein [Dolichospermum sp. FACHB-1091]MBD2442179.1 hypothetical protein [Dolichospermum sp. FACHB-1091]
MTRQLLTGNRFWATLLFVTYVGFFPFTYLSLQAEDYWQKINIFNQT